MNRPIVTATLVFAVLALPAVGDAQIAGSNNRAPIAYGADAVEYVGGTLTLNGRAELIQGDNRLRANRISGFNNTGGESRMEATGDVFFVTPEQTIRGDRAVYTTADGVIVVTGDVILTQGQNVATGSRLTYNVRTESARFDSGASGRVQGVFYPDQTGN
jgi:lipopolysaccharide export system protein LptA